MGRVTEISYVTITWSIITTAALLLGLMHLARWSMDRQARADLTFSVVALSFVAVAITELGTMHAVSPETWGQWVKWCHLPLAIMVIGTVAFVQQYLDTGRAWLAALVIGLRLLIFAINFVSDPNINFDRIDSLERIRFLGEYVSVVGEAVTGRWQLLGTVASVLLAVYVLDAAVGLWRQGGAGARRRALVIGGGVFFFVSVAATYVQLVIWGILSLPLLITPCFVLTLLAMAFELSRDSLHASKLALDLEESRRRLELAADAADVGLCEWDDQSGRVWATARAMEIFGLSEREGGNAAQWLERVHPDDAPRVRAEIQAALAKGGDLNAEYRVCPPGRGTRWVAVRGRVELRSGRHTRVRGSVRDITEQRTSMNETQELRRELAHAGRVSVLGQLASSLAHELSQPLGAILRNVEAAEMLLAGAEPDHEELKAIVADIHRDDRRAGEVIDRLRALLKRRQIVPQPIDLEALVNDVQSLVRADAVSRHVAIGWTVESGLPTVSGDRVHLSQVLINLIINAMDAVMELPPGQRHVTVGARRCRGEGVELNVTDSGPGIPAEHLARVFEPFFTTKDAGMGMGLSVCQTIVHAHHGLLTANNLPDGGAIFRIRLNAVAEQRA